MSGLDTECSNYRELNSIEEIYAKLGRGISNAKREEFTNLYEKFKKITE